MSRDQSGLRLQSSRAAATGAAALGCNEGIFVLVRPANEAPWPEMDARPEPDSAGQPGFAAGLMTRNGAERRVLILGSLFSFGPGEFELDTDLQAEDAIAVTQAPSA